MKYGLDRSFPYRETKSAIARAKEMHALCVRWKQLLFYAFGKANGEYIICFAHLTNAMAQAEGDFKKGEKMGSLKSLKLIDETIRAISCSD